MTPEIFHDYVMLPALDFFLPHKYNTVQARAMVLAIALQESELKHRRQTRGPARSFFQFEKAGISGVLTHSASRPDALEVCRMLGYRPVTSEIYEAIEHNDMLAVCFARLLLWTLPHRLPQENESGMAWAQYMDAWRPGKPRGETWAANFEKSWETVT